MNSNNVPIQCVCETMEFQLILYWINLGKTATAARGYYGAHLGQLSQLDHGVSGDVYAVDSRTLFIKNFNYDGEGPGKIDSLISLFFCCCCCC